MGEQEITAFLTYLAVDKHVAASTQNQALSAILFLYKKVLNIEPGWIEGVVRAKRPKRLPVVLKRDVVRKLLNQLRGPQKLLAYLIYSSGLRLMEVLRLRIKDVDFTAMIYTHVLQKGGRGARSPLHER